MKTIQILIMITGMVIYGAAIFAQDSKGNGMVNDPTGKKKYIDTNHMRLYPDTNHMKIYQDTNHMQRYPDTNHIKRYRDTPLKKMNEGKAGNQPEINRPSIISKELNQKIFEDILFTKADKREVFYLKPEAAQLF